MIDIDLIRRKMSRLIMYLDRLAPFGKKSLNEYLADDYLKFSAERLIQLIVECAVDINNHVVVENQERPPEDYRSSFKRAADVKMISPELAKNLQGSASLRNILVHEYMEIDDKIVLESVSLILQYYPEYLREVDQFLQTIER